MTPQPVRSFSSREKTRSREKARKARKRTPGHLFIPFPSSQNACAFSRFANPRSRPISALADLPDHFPRERPNGQIRRSRGKTDRSLPGDHYCPAPSYRGRLVPRPRSPLLERASSGLRGLSRPGGAPPGLGCRRSLGAPLRPPRAARSGRLPAAGSRPSARASCRHRRRRRRARPSAGPRVRRTPRAQSSARRAAVRRPGRGRGRPEPTRGVRAGRRGARLPGRAGTGSGAASPSSRNPSSRRARASIPRIPRAARGPLGRASGTRCSSAARCGSSTTTRSRPTSPRPRPRWLERRGASSRTSTSATTRPSTTSGSGDVR